MKAPGDSEQQEGEGSCAGVSWPKETLYWLMKDIQSSTKLAETQETQCWAEVMRKRGFGV